MAVRMRKEEKEIKNLNENNRKIYAETKLFLRRDIKKRSERQAVLDEFFELLWDAQKRGVSSEELFPEGYDAFYLDLISGLTIYPAPEKRKRILRTRAIAIGLSILCAGIILLQYLTAQGYIGVWAEGINYIATDFNHYTYTTRPHQEKVSFTIDFRRWEEYENVVIYRSGDITVELENLDETGGWYRIFFRTHGSYSREYATLLSWRKYAFDESHTAEWTQTAELLCDYGGKNYPCRLLGFTNLNFKNGEEFSFYVPAAISPDTHAEIAEFHLRNLTWSFWERKSETIVIT